MMKKLFMTAPAARKLLVASIGLGLAGGIFIILEAVWLAGITDRAFLDGEGLKQLLPALMVLLGWIILRALVHIAGEWISTAMAARVKEELRNRMVRKLIELGPQAAKKERSGELIAALYEGVEQLETFLARYIPQAALAALIPVAVLCAVLRLDWTTALILAVTLPLLIFFMILIGMTTKAKTKLQYKKLGVLSAHFHDVVRGLPTLRIFNRSRSQLEIIARIGEEHRKATMGTLRLAFMSAFVMELFATLCTAIVAVFLGLRLIDGGIAFYNAYCVLLLAPEFYGPVRALGTQFHTGANGRVAAERILDLLEQEPPGWTEREGARTLEAEAGSGKPVEGGADAGAEAVDSGAGAADVGAVDGADAGAGAGRAEPAAVRGGSGRGNVSGARGKSGGYEIRLEGVSFRYPEESMTVPENASSPAAQESAGEAREAKPSPVRPAALSGINLTIRAGQKVALIGPTGAGKSTLLELVQGFIRPVEGAILINGVDMAELSIGWWRKQLAVVAQRTHLFQGTIADNIRLGRPDATMEEVLEASRRAQADEFIRVLPRGYDTRIGEAVRLSGGQMQRLAIARSLLKDAPVLLLDEPTAQLDLHNEALVQSAWSELFGGRTVIMAAHRLDTVRAADWLVVLQEGEITEAGKPDELLRQGGKYAAMVAAAVHSGAAAADSLGAATGFMPAKPVQAVSFVSPGPDKEVAG
ncbi:MAG: hypothetical protein K0R57_5624 [Paenibacillaceae bacterium]|jgi:ABC-type transport system involved in cytochrome bd biosynthesis fused ATPase/permease subunit|nr:hypothetical protein [Paenibacillaceae bacterium]